MRVHALLLGSAAMLVLLGVAGGPAAARAQGVWQGPQPPCVLEPGHRLVEEVMEHLKVATETEFFRQRDRHLRDAQEVLTRAFQAFAQEGNAAAWYYLGRYHIDREDAAGADTSFARALALAPECRSDIDIYRAEIGAPVLMRALEAWQAQQPDSATAAFALAGSLMPWDANVPYYRARMYVESRRFDEARQQVAYGDSIGAGSPNFDRQRRGALLDLARAYEGQVTGTETAERVARNRMLRDSLAGAAPQDSMRLANLIAQFAGANLRPEVQAAVQRDSTRFAQRLTAAREGLAQVTEAIERDSSELTSDLGPAIEAYRSYVADYPEDQSTVFRLLRLAATVGVAKPFDDGVAALGSVAALDVDEVSQIALQVFNGGFYAWAARLLELGLETNPYHRSTLYLLGRSHYAMRNAEGTVPVAQRLMEVDPLNPQSAQLLAMAFDLQGEPDSAQHYLNVSRSGMEWVVTVQQFVPTDSATVLTGTVRNVVNRPLAATMIAFEFIASDGTVVGAADSEIPALQPGASHTLRVRVEQGGAVGWRYRKK